MVKENIKEVGDICILLKEMENVRVTHIKINLLGYVHHVTQPWTSFSFHFFIKTKKRNLQNSSVWSSFVDFFLFKLYHAKRPIIVIIHLSCSFIEGRPIDRYRWIGLTWFLFSLVLGLMFTYTYIYNVISSWINEKENQKTICTSLFLARLIWLFFHVHAQRVSVWL